MVTQSRGTEAGANINLFVGGDQVLLFVTIYKQVLCQWWELFSIYQEFSAFAKKAKMFEWLWGWFKSPVNVSNLSEEELALLNIEKPDEVFNFSKAKCMMLSDPFQPL